MMDILEKQRLRFVWLVCVTKHVGPNQFMEDRSMETGLPTSIATPPRVKKRTKRGLRYVPIDIKETDNNARNGQKQQQTGSNEQ